MRISSQQIFDSNIRSLQTHTTDVVEAQRQISSGQKYKLASDNALAAGLGVQVNFDNAQFAMFKVNQDHVSASLASSDSQLQSIHDMLANLQKTMVQASNDTLGSENRKLLGQQAESLRLSISRFSEAKDANGQSILRTDTINSVLVAPSLSLETGISYAEVMGRSQPGGTLTVGKIDVATLLQNITTQLSAGSAPTTQQFDDLKSALDQVMRAQVKTGVLQNQLDAAINAAESQRLNVENERSELLDTDLAQASANLARSNALLQAAQSIMTKLDTNTLFQKL
jgi:flagellin-like hook-associated protein FlgL